jgi:hypothetical protein
MYVRRLIGGDSSSWWPAGREGWKALPDGRCVPIRLVAACKLHGGAAMRWAARQSCSNWPGSLTHWKRTGVDRRSMWVPFGSEWFFSSPNNLSQDLSDCLAPFLTVSLGTRQTVLWCLRQTILRCPHRTILWRWLRAWSAVIVWLAAGTYVRWIWVVPLMCDGGWGVRFAYTWDTGFWIWFEHGLGRHRFGLVEFVEGVVLELEQTSLVKQIWIII